MKELLTFTLLGLASGAFISGLSLTAVVSYQGAGVVNLANGAIAMLGGYIFLDLRTEGRIPVLPGSVTFGGAVSTGPALVVAVLLCALLGGLFDVVVLRRLRNSAPLAKLVAALGLLLTLQAFVLTRFGSNAQAAPNVLPVNTVTLLGIPIPISQFIFAGIVILMAIVLVVGYRRTRFGLATRAAAEDEAMAMRNGLSPARLSLANSVLSAGLAGLLGVLFAPLSQLDSSTLALAIVPALAAALLGQFSSFGIAALAGFAMGVIQSLVEWLQGKDWFPNIHGNHLPGVTDLIFFVVIALVLFSRGHVLPGRGTAAERRLPEAPAATRIAVPIMTGTVIGVFTLVFFPAAFRLAEINTLIGMIVCLSFVVVTGYLGQVSLLPMALAGICALVLTKLSVSSGIGFPFAPMIGVALSVVVGTLTAIPTLRVRGVSLAILTLAGAVAVSNFWLGNQDLGFDALSGVVSPPRLFGRSIGPGAAFHFGPGGTPSAIFGFLCLGVTLTAALLVLHLRRGDLGKRMLAIRSDERAAAASGVRIRETKLVGYGISSLLAGTAGALYAYSFGAVTAPDFDVTVVLGFIAVAYIGGITTVTGALLGGLASTEALVPYSFTRVLGIPANVTLMVAGLLLIFTVVQHPSGIVGAFTTTWRRHSHRLRLQSGPSLSRLAMPKDVR